MAITIDLARRALEVAGKSPANLAYFYSQLNSTEWIGPLRDLKVFQTPVAPVREEGSVAFPHWPESQYLARMAVVAPQLVFEVLSSIPSTDNFSIRQDFIGAALSMPPELSAKLAIKEAMWIETQDRLSILYPDKVGELISYLARSGQIGPAIRLAKSLLAVDLDSRTTRAEYPLSPEPKAKFDNWHYQQILEKNISDLRAKAPHETFILLVDLLESAMEIAQSEQEASTKAKEDFSWIWRPEIAHEHLHSFKEVLVTGVRDIALADANASRQAFDKVILELDKREWRIFRRIRLFVLAKSSQTQNLDVQAILRDEQRFQAAGTDKEFDLLLKEWFGRTDPDTQEAILGLINAGPNLERVRERWEKNTGKAASEDQLQRHVDFWRLSWLNVISDSLPPDSRSTRDKLISQIGPVEHEPTTFVGPTSPSSPEELAALSPEQLFDYLRGWKPSGHWASPTPEGLARTLSGVIASNPSRYSASLSQFKALDPTYVRGVVDGFREAVKNKKSFKWDDVLQLCEWVVNQPRQINRTNRESDDVDPDWGWCRSSIAWLISEALATDAVSPERGDTIWKILSILVEDPDPDASRNGGYHFLGGLSVNSVRGVALEGVIRYGLWEQQHGPLQMDRLAAVLERHLDLKLDSSYVVREVCGHYFPWLAKLDERWAADHVPTIFPPEQEDHRWVAWQNYVVFSWPYDNTFPMLLGEYAWAITKIGVAKSRDSEEVERHLAQHLMTLYWRGKLDLGTDGLLSKFYAQAPADLRSTAMEFIGRSLQVEPETPIQHGVMERLADLWHYRLEQVTSNPETSREELADFGWWFISGRFDKEWACAQLLTALKEAKKIEPDFEVIKTLLKYFDERPEFVLDVLYLVIEADREGWSFHGWSDEAREILDKALKMKNDPDVWVSAKRVIDLLVLKGHFEFRTMLARTKD